MVIIIMGVSGSGKSHIGEMLAKELSLPFYDADSFHPDSNVRKMKQGKPLDDADRQPWLRRLADKIQEWNQAGGAVLACSALKESYRVLLSQNYTNHTQFVYLKGDQSLISSRMQARNHFFPPHLLDSQFADLEEPQRAVIAEINQAPAMVVKDILQAIEH